MRRKRKQQNTITEPMSLIMNDSDIMRIPSIGIGKIIMRKMLRRFLLGVYPMSKKRATSTVNLTFLFLYVGEQD